ASPAESPQTSPASTEQNDQTAVAQTSVSPSPAAEVMPVKVASSSILAKGRMWLVGGLLLAALLILAWVIVPTLRRRYAFDVPSSGVSLIGSAMGSEAESFVGSVVEQAAENGESLHTDTPQKPEMAAVLAINELTEVTATAPQATVEIPESVEEITWPADEASEVFDGAIENASFPEEPAEIPPDTGVALPAVTTLTELPVESISLEPTMPDQTVSPVIPTPVLARAAMLPSDSPPKAASAEPVFSQTTTPAIMPETTQTPTAPADKAPAPPMAKPQQPPAVMQ